MTTPSQIYPYGGSFTVLNDRVDVTCTGLPLQIPLQTVYSRINIVNATQWGLTPATPTMKSAWWTLSDTQGSAYVTQNVTAVATNQDLYFAANGIYLYNNAYPPVYPIVTGGTSISNTNPATANIPNTFVNGQVVQLFDVVGAAQLNGYQFTITNVSPTGFTIPYLNASGFAAGATSFSARVVDPLLTTPSLGQITAIQSVGTQTVITLAAKTNIFVGATVWITLTQPWGMPQLNIAGAGIPDPYQVTAVNTNTNQITIDVNSSYYNAFTFPNNATAMTTALTIPQVNPYGQGSMFNNGSEVMQYQNTTIQNGSWILGLGSNVCGNSGDIMHVFLTAEGTVYQYPIVA